MTSNELSLDELFSVYTTTEQIKDSFEKRSVPTGRYTFQASKAVAQVDDRETFQSGEINPNHKRQSANFFGSLKNNEGKRMGSVGFSASWEVRHQTDKNGRKRQDGQSSLWGQLVVALDMKAGSVADVITAAGSYPLSVYVNEAFRTPVGWRTAKDDSDRAEYRKLGYESKNFVQSISRVK
jgi:hypothetical protein